MKIGIISDSHDNLDAIRKCVKVFRKDGISLLIHGGDIISPFAAAEFKELNCPVKAVFGNNDGERKILSKKMTDLGGEIADYLEFTLDGLKFALYHGTYPGVLKSLIDSKNFNVVVTGHSHEPEIKKVRETLVINPGESCGYLSGRRTAVILDSRSLQADLLDIDEDYI